MGSQHGNAALGTWLSQISPRTPQINQRQQRGNCSPLHSHLLLMPRWSPRSIRWCFPWVAFKSPQTWGSLLGNQSQQPALVNPPLLLIKFMLFFPVMPSELFSPHTSSGFFLSLGLKLSRHLFFPHKTRVWSFQLQSTLQPQLINPHNLVARKVLLSVLYRGNK